LNVRIDSEQLARHLERTLAPLYTVHGEETLLALEAADRIRLQARAQGYSEREVLTAEAGFDWSQLAMSANSLSLFASRRILELRIPSGKPGNDGAEALKRFASDLPPDTLVLVSLPRLDRTTLAAGWFQALEQAGVAVAANAVTPARLPQWLGGRLRQQGQEADADTLALLAGMVEGNLLAAQQELHKLALLFPRGKLTREGVECAVLDVARFDVFRLGEALLGGDPARLTRMLEGLRGEGAAPPLVLWAIAEELHALWRVSAAVAGGKPLQLALREARVWGPRAELLPRALRRIRGRELEAALLGTADVDRTIKGLTRGDAWTELLRLALSLTGSQAGNRGRINA
jgi:DNA polymerase-3 subunit delta